MYTIFHKRYYDIPDVMVTLMNGAHILYSLIWRKTDVCIYTNIYNASQGSRLNIYRYLEKDWAE